MAWAAAVMLTLATGSIWTFTTGCQTTPSPPKAKPAPAVASSHLCGLTILASGARRFELVDPQGRRMLRDVRTDESISEIPGASIEGLSSEHDAGGDLDDGFSGYDLDIPMAADGHYTVRVDADNGLSMSVTAYSDSGVFASEAAIDTTARPISNSYDILYSLASRSVTIRKQGKQESQRR
jgi:hypothetical protein